VALILSLMMLFQLEYFCEVQLDGIKVMDVAAHTRSRTGGLGADRFISAIPRFAWRKFAEISSDF
jgi:hypothetical protein